jgi:hypothetical protein
MIKIGPPKHLGNGAVSFPIKFNYGSTRAPEEYPGGREIEIELYLVEPKKELDKLSEM